MNLHTFPKLILVVGMRMNARMARMALEFHLAILMLVDDFLKVNQ